MSYILNKTDGSVLTVVQDATIDQTTSLTFVGKNYAGYGEYFEENFVGLLENFANTAQPVNPLKGQLWFNTSPNNKQLSVYDGTRFKGIGSVTIDDPTMYTNTSTGDLFWSQGILYGYDGGANGAGLVQIGPTEGNNFSNWQFGRQSPTTGDNIPVIRGYCGTLPVAVISNQTFTPSNYNPNLSANLGPGIAANTFTTVAKGISLPGATGVVPLPNPNSSPVPGSTIGSGFYFWGTSAESLSSRASYITGGVAPASTNFYIPFVSTSSGSTQLLADSNFSYTADGSGHGVLNVTATAAYYADLAERYEADAVYEEGTVLVIGGNKEVTITTTFADTRVAGVVSKKPAYLMNKDAGTDETHPAIALKGRVPCKVEGYIRKGDLIVTSSTPGYGTAANSVSAGAVIGKALGSQSEGFGVIEILVV